MGFFVACMMKNLQGRIKMFGPAFFEVYVKKKMKTNRSKLRIKEVRTCSLCSWSAGPIPDRIRMAGDPYVPAVNITSLSVCTLNEIPLCINSIPCALLLEIKTCKIGVKFDIGFILHMYIVICKTLITS